MVGEVDLECPLKKDDEVTLTKDVELPNEIPPGKYTVTADVVIVRLSAAERGLADPRVRGRFGAMVGAC